MPWQECSIEDVLAEGLRPRQARARASVLATVVASAASRMIAMVGSFPRVAAGTYAGIEGVTCITAVVETFMHRDRGAQPIALRCLVD